MVRLAREMIYDCNAVDPFKSFLSEMIATIILASSPLYTISVPNCSSLNFFTLNLITRLIQKFVQTWGQKNQTTYNLK